jgi:N-acetylglucosamine-6-phosphate deacetylase
MSAGFAISGAPIFDGDIWHQGRVLVVDDGKIASIAVHDDIPHDLDVHDVGGGMIVPGFVDQWGWRRPV